MAATRPDKAKDVVSPRKVITPTPIERERERRCLDLGQRRNLESDVRDPLFWL